MACILESEIESTPHGQICKSSKHPFFMSVANAPATHFLSYSMVKCMAACIDEERDLVKHKCAFQFHGFHLLLHANMNKYDLNQKDIEIFVTCSQIIRSQQPGQCFDWESNTQCCCGITQVDSSLDVKVVDSVPALNPADSIVGGEGH